MYSLGVARKVDKAFMRLAKKDPEQSKAVDRKVQEILENPQQFKPLRPPMQHMRRVHVGAFVLVYDVDEARKVVTIRRYEHHYNAYNIR